MDGSSWHDRRSHARRASVLAILMLIALVSGAWSAVLAQERSVVPENEEATIIFRQGLMAFEAGDYGMAYRRFRLIEQALPLNRLTTAARLMAGKALYRQERFGESIALLEDFVRRFPGSRYVSEARRILSLAGDELAGAGVHVEPIQLGIALPLSGGNAALTQALFNGIRIAVEDHNAMHGGELPVRMIFRDTEGTRSGARQAMSELVQTEGLRLVLGPLFSEEAEAAAAVAEAAGVVMVAPMATDESVSDGRNYVFQINPTWTVRGRMMAVFAQQRFGIEVAGVVAQLGDSYGERMAEGFQDEALRLGMNVPFYVLLNTNSDWNGVADTVGAARIDSVEVLYLPIASGNAGLLAASALTSLANAGVNLRVLGNIEWSDLAARDLATRFDATHTADFYVMPDDPAATTFVRKYQELAGDEPRGEAIRLAYTGYDVGRFLIERLYEEGDVPLADRLRTSQRFQGLGVRIDFAGGNVNRALYFFQHRPGRLDLLR